MSMIREPHPKLTDPRSPKLTGEGGAAVGSDFLGRPRPRIDDGDEEEADGNAEYGAGRGVEYRELALNPGVRADPTDCGGPSAGLPWTSMLLSMALTEGVAAAGKVHLMPLGSDRDRSP